MVLLAGCMVKTTTATPSELAVHGPTFTQDGRAELLRSDGNVTISADERVTVRVQDGDLQHIETMTVRELVRGCNSEGADDGCLARRVVSEPVLKHRVRTFDSDAAAKLVGISAMGGLVGYCAAECQGDGDLQRGLLYTGGFIGGTLALGFLLMALGGHD